ncbi:MAG: ATP-binding cassette domain-containing protein, partial [Romboutsia sp.]
MNSNNEMKLKIRNLDLFYGDNQALKKINMNIKENKVTALIGPSGCGKSTFLRTLNRMNDLIDNVTIKGNVEVDGEDIYKSEDVIKLRTKVGMVFQKPNPFPMSIYDN